MSRQSSSISSWTISAPRILPRSKLFHIKPIGLGTPLIESQASYASRTADAHHVTLYTLINHAIIPLLKHSRLDRMVKKGVIGFYETTRSLNGMDERAEHLAKALGELTGQSSIRAMTMLPWVRILPSVNLLKAQRMWCPDCIKEWMHNGSIIYEPLIWSVDSIIICDIHQLSLEHICPYCGKRVRLSNFRVQPGTCSNCGHHLDKRSDRHKSVPLSANDLAKYRWYWKSVSSMIAHSPILINQSRRSIKAVDGLAPSLRLHKTFAKCIDTYYSGNIDLASSNLGITRNTAWSWYLGYSLPHFEVILKICGQHTLDIVSLIAKSKLQTVKDLGFNMRKIEIPIIRVKSRSINISSIRNDAKINEITRLPNWISGGSHGEL